MDSLRSQAFALAVLAASSVGCASQTAGQFTSAGYTNPTYSYTVSYMEGALVLPQGWVLDNFFSSPNGLFPRKDQGYVTSVHLDRDGDRNPDGALRLAAYDLRFVHGEHPGVIWLRTFPYSYHLHEKPLEQLAQDYVAYMSATGVEQAVIDDRAPGDPRVSIKLDSRASWMVAGHPAEVLSVEETPITGGVARKAFVAVIRPGFMYQYSNRRQGNVLYPVLMVAGYSNAPGHFSRGLPDYQALLKQIRVQGVSGLTISGSLDGMGDDQSQKDQGQKDQSQKEEKPAVDDSKDDETKPQAEEPTTDDSDALDGDEPDADDSSVGSEVDTTEESSG